jgi:hypothetical protein
MGLVTASALVLGRIDRARLVRMALGACLDLFGRVVLVTGGAILVFVDRPGSYTCRIRLVATGAIRPLARTLMR